jgi:hypothetical protein
LSENKLVGYGVLRKSVKGYRLGPFFADDVSIGIELMNYFASKVEKTEKIFLDIPERS